MHQVLGAAGRCSGDRSPLCKMSIASTLAQASWSLLPRSCTRLKVNFST